MRNKDIRNIVYAALFAAIASVLKIYSLQITADWRISLFAIPLILAGFYLGPAYGLTVGFVTDTVYMIISPYASIWSIYTISTMIWGLSGYLIKTMRGNIISIIIILALTSLLETSINSIAMLVEGGKDWYYVASGLPKRLITLVLRLPILITITKNMIDRLKIMQIDFN